MKVWDYAFKTNPAHTKEVSFGARKFTTVDAYQQIKKATQMWGAMGTDWGVFDEKFTLIGSKTMLYTATLYYPKIEHEGKHGNIAIHSDDLIVKGQNNKYNEDWSKKLATDALTKGLSKLGFNCDIFTGQFEQQKYH